MNWINKQTKKHYTKLSEMVFVPIIGLQEKDKHEVQTILSKSIYFSSMETTRSPQGEKRFLLITINNMKTNFQREVDNLFGKYYRKKQCLKTTLLQEKELHQVIHPTSHLIQASLLTYIKQQIFPTILLAQEYSISDP